MGYTAASPVDTLTPVALVGMVQNAPIDAACSLGMHLWRSQALCTTIWTGPPCHHGGAGSQRPSRNLAGLHQQCLPDCRCHGQRRTACCGAASTSGKQQQSRCQRDPCSTLNMQSCFGCAPCSVSHAGHLHWATESCTMHNRCKFSSSLIIVNLSYLI